jgi:hypothetical protein
VVFRRDIIEYSKGFEGLGYVATQVTLLNIDPFWSPKMDSSHIEHPCTLAIGDHQTPPFSLVSGMLSAAFPASVIMSALSNSAAS